MRAPVGLLAATLIMGAAPPVSTQTTAADSRAVLTQYCFACHNDRLKTGGLSLERMDLTSIGESPDVWEKVVRRLRTGAMPPAPSRRPDQATYDRLTSWLEGELDRGAAALPNPGRPLLHRLNRAEYGNVIRDLLAVDVDVRRCCRRTTRRSASTTTPTSSSSRRRCSSGISPPRTG